MNDYKPRIVDEILAKKLEAKGAVLIDVSVRRKSPFRVRQKTPILVKEK